jgi:hypothetical protein
MRSMPSSFRPCTDSPHPFRLQPPPPPRTKSVKQETSEENQTSITPNPPISTRYIDMLLDLDNISTIYNLLANLFTWLLLAGYMVLPGAFTSIGNSRVLSDNAGKAGKVVVKAAQNLPLLWVAGICCVLGASGMCWLGWLWQRNYLWLVNRIILYVEVPHSYTKANILGAQVCLIRPQVSSLRSLTSIQLGVDSGL